MSEPAVHIDGVHRRFISDSATVQALSGVDLDIADGEFVCIIGPSGCGKSTLFHIVAGLDDPSEGHVSIGGDTTRLGRSAFMPQKDALLPWRRVVDNITIGPRLNGVSRAEARAQAMELLERFGLGEFARSWPWQLSGGMRSRVAFLRTVVQERPVLLLDEPFGALDGLTRTEVQLWLLDVWAEVRPAVVMITHDVAEAAFLADRVIVMSPRPGRIVDEIAVPLQRPRTVELLETEEFAAVERRLRESLRRHAH